MNYGSGGFTGSEGPGGSSADLGGATGTGGGGVLTVSSDAGTDAARDIRPHDAGPDSGWTEPPDAP